MGEDGRRDVGDDGLGILKYHPDYTGTVGPLAAEAARLAHRVSELHHRPGIDQHRVWEAWVWASLRVTRRLRAGV